MLFWTPTLPPLAAADRLSEWQPHRGGDPKLINRESQNLDRSLKVHKPPPTAAINSVSSVFPALTTCSHFTSGIYTPAGQKDPGALMPRGVGGKHLFR